MPNVFELIPTYSRSLDIVDLKHSVDTLGQAAVRCWEGFIWAADSGCWGYLTAQVSTVYIYDRYRGNALPQGIQIVLDARF
jgi:hypothetical protein